VRQAGNVGSGTGGRSHAAVRPVWEPSGLPRAVDGGDV